jgi:hypothetical protein
MVGDGSGMFGLVRDGSKWSGLVQDGQGWFRMVKVGLPDGLFWHLLYLQWLTISLAPTFFTPQSEQK